MIRGAEFRNSDTCEGVVFTDFSADIDISVIEITGRYPEAGWAVNHTVHEMVYIRRGLGSLAIHDAGETQLSEGNVVSIAPGQRFAWNGKMTLIMACNPPFDPGQYEIEEDI